MTEIWETTEKVVVVLPSGEKEVDGPVTADQIRAFARDEGIRKFTVIQKLITVVEIINLDSAYSGDPKTDAHAIVYSQPMKDHTEVWEG